MQIKVAPRGIKIICIILAIPYILTFMGSALSTKLVNLPDAKKLELMKEESYKKFGIDSIQKFDARFKPSAKQLSNPWFIIGFPIILILIFGLWTLAKWAPLITILYLISGIVAKVSLLILEGNKLTASWFGALFSSTLWIVIIYYISRPSIKERFK